MFRSGAGLLPVVLSIEHGGMDTGAQEKGEEPDAVFNPSQTKQE